MKRLIAALLCVPALALASLSADAKPFRWASQGDPQTADPHSQNESLTNLFSQAVHDTLVMRDNSLKLVPGLATSWQQVNPTTWRFTLRQGVKFHDGTPFTADDVIFTWERASHPNSQLRQYAIPVGKPRKIDDYTVEFVQDKPNPVTLEHATTIYVMSKALGDEEQGRPAAGLQGQGGDVRVAQRQRNRDRGSSCRGSRAYAPC